jgi:hypothetical protein
MWEKNDKIKFVDTNFWKTVCVANLALGSKFLKETQNHLDSRAEEDAKMTLEKLQLLAISLVECTQKAESLKWWNSKQLVRENLKLHNNNVSKEDFTKCLHKATFWG